MRIHRKAWSGVALMLGGLGFLLTKARHWIDPADRFLAPYMALSLFLLLWGSVAF
jgi:Na+-translocating ferredoxin:NAD+ oxidoreductase RnfD subunit